MRLELTFEGRIEGDELPDIPPGRAYAAGADFYDASGHPKLCATKESINSIELGPGLTFPMNVVSLHWFAKHWEGLGVADTSTRLRDPVT